MQTAKNSNQTAQADLSLHLPHWSVVSIVLSCCGSYEDLGNLNKVFEVVKPVRMFYYIEIH